MTAIRLDGKTTRDEIFVDLRERVAKLTAAGHTPGLGTILVGDDPGSQAYVRGKHADCAKVGINSIRRDLPADISQATLDATIDELNATLPQDQMTSEQIEDVIGLDALRRLLQHGLVHVRVEGLPDRSHALQALGRRSMSGYLMQSVLFLAIFGVYAVVGELLLRRQGEVLSRTEIAERVWDINFDSGTNVIDVAIGRLRHKLDAPFERPILHTVRGFGYVLEERR